MDPRIVEIEKTQVRSDLPAFAPGDTVRVRVRVSEGAKERIQAFEGICIARKGGSLNETFTVRKISGGVGVERIFPVHSPSIAWDRSGAPRSCPSREALLPAGPARQERQGARASVVGGRRIVAQGRG